MASTSDVGISSTSTYGISMDFPVGNVRSLNICSDPMALGVPHHSVET